MPESFIRILFRKFHDKGFKNYCIANTKVKEYLISQKLVHKKIPQTHFLLNSTYRINTISIILLNPVFLQLKYRFLHRELF